MHYLFFIILATVWGTGFYLMKLAGFAFGPLTIGASSTLGGSIFLWGSWLVKRRKWQIGRQQVFPLLFVSLFGYTYPFAMQPFLVEMIGHGFVGMMVSLVPILTIIVSIPLLGVLPSRVQLTGVLVGMVAIALMVIDGLDRNAKPFYLLLAVSVPVFYAISNTLVQKSFRDVPAIVVAALFMTVSTIILTPLSLVFEGIKIDDRFMIAISAIALLSFFSRGLGMALFYRLIQTKGPLFAGLVTYVIPVEALMWSWVDNERITLTQVSAIAIVLLMVGFVQRDIIRRSVQPK